MKFFENNNLGTTTPYQETNVINNQITEDKLASIGIGSETIEIINKIPGITLEKLEQRIDFMESVGLKRTRRHIEKYPFQSIVCSDQDIVDHVDELNSLGLDATQILDKQIQLLFVSINNIKKRFEILSKIFDEKLIKILTKSPGVLGQSSESILSKIGFMSDIGIQNPTNLIRTAPETLTLATNSIESQIKNIKTMFPNIDLEDFIRKFPKVFTYSEEKLAERKKNIDRIISIYGVDFSSQDLVSMSPQILTYGYPRMIIVVRLLKKFNQDDPREVIKLITRGMDDILVAACDNYSIEEGGSFDNFMHKIHLSSKSDLSKNDKKEYVNENLGDEKILKQIPKLGR